VCYVCASTHTPGCIFTNTGALAAHSRWPSWPAYLSASAQTLPSETPDEFKAPVDSFDYIKRTVMIPMRDGVKLNTVIVIPRKARNAPMLLTRTPYNAADMTSHAESSQMDVMLQGYDNLPDVIGKGGYIRVVQDVRGKYGSEGGYVMNRPLAGTPSIRPRSIIPPMPGTPSSG
jgi:predicted acyl esterase